MPEKQKGVIKRNQANQGTSNTRTNHLLVIGIDNYANGIPTLNNAVRDAENFRDLLLKNYQFSEENLTCLFNEAATRANIIDTFSELLEKLTEEDNLIFYYSGHGEQIKKGKGTRGYWIPSDAKLDKTWSYIPNADITALFKDTLAHHVLGIVDSCFSGSLFQQRKLTNAEERIRSYPSRWLLTAGRLEPVSDGSLGENSPFATSLLTYLKNSPDDSLWISDLCNRVLKGMQFNTTNQTPRGEPLQDVGHYGGQFVFYKKGVTPQPETVAPKTDVSMNETTRGTTTETAKPPPQAQLTAKSPTNLAELKKYLKEQINEDIGKTIKSFQSYLVPDSSQENDLILQMGRYNSNKNQLLKGIITNDQANRTNNQIRYAVLSYIDDLEKEDVQFPTSATTDTLITTLDLQKLEQAGLKSQAELLIKKLNHLKNALLLETDASKQFKYEHQIEKLEEQLNALKHQLE